ncbi:MAG: BACON domain-containing protein [Bacteroidales bacterium]|nr:BACON domain-containing protein [Bacteroidales bacterium]MCI2145237.1 BACON domain-containing protein [Bacteroidales bacterium]
MISMLTAVMCGLALIGCVESDPPMITVSKNSVNAGCEAQSISLTVTSNAKWTASSNSSWLQLSRSEGTNTEDIAI